MIDGALHNVDTLLNVIPTYLNTGGKQHLLHICIPELKRKGSVRRREHVTGA